MAAASENKHTAINSDAEKEHRVFAQLPLSSGGKKEEKISPPFFNSKLRDTAYFIRDLQGYSIITLWMLLGMLF